MKKKVVVREKKMKAPRISKVGQVCAEGEQCFWSNDGRILSTLADLAGALKEMSAETYGHHVTSDRNDYANWVEFVLLDKKTAGALRKAKNQKAAIAVVEKAL